MKEIMQSYGAAIIAVILIMGLLSNFSTIKNSIAILMSNEQVLDGDYEKNAYDSYRNVGIPHLLLREDEYLINEKILCSELFLVEKYEENLQRIEIVEVLDMENNCVVGLIMDDGNAICFSNPGIYTLHVKVICKNDLENIIAVSLPVNY